jgi:hypothetical protein
MPTPADTVATQEALTAGWEALAVTDWEGARASFEAAMAKAPTAEALEGRSHAAWWLDDAETMFEARGARLSALPPRRRSSLRSPHGDVPRDRLLSAPGEVWATCAG